MLALIKKYYISLIVIFFLITNIILWNMYNSEKIAKQQIENRISIEQTITSIEEPSNANIHKRQDDNIVIDRSIKELDKQLIAIDKTKKEINKTKGNIPNEIKKADIRNISNKLASMGYSNSVVFNNYTTKETNRHISKLLNSIKNNK